MKKEKRQYPDDDGRTIASMANIESPYARMLFIPFAGKRRKQSGEKPHPADAGLTRQEERQVVRAARNAAVLTGLGIFAVLALLLLFCVFVWFK